MAAVRLADAIEPVVFESYTRQMTTELWNYLQGGIVTRNALFDAIARQEGSIMNVPYWNDLVSTESNVGSDDPASPSVPLKMGSGQQIGIKNRRNQSWSAMDLVAPLAGSDPMREIAGKVAAYWSRDIQNTLLAITNGIIADNVANYASDMIHDISDDAAGDPAAGTLVTGPEVIAAWATMGDHSSDLAGIGMHSVVFHNLQAQELITYLQPAETDVRIPSYLGLRVFVDDSMPSAAQANQTWYTTVLYGQDAFGYGEGAPKVPTETERLPSAGDGEGQEVLYNRKHYLLHPRGFAFQSASMAGVSPTNAEHATATNWDRLYERKNVRMAFLVSNG